MKEYEMFPMVKSHFEALGYKVNAEVKDCDVTAFKDDELRIIEMKTSLNVTLLYQALERKKITPYVYIAVPKPKKNFRKSILKMKDLISRLQIGLLIVDVVNGACASYVEPVEGATQKINVKKKAKVIKEIGTREVDQNIGGVTKTKILTAYKELGISLCVAIKKEGIVTSKVLREKYGFDNNVNKYLYTNFNRWYERVDKATYKLSKEGELLLLDKEYINAINHYKNKFENIDVMEVSKVNSKVKKVT